MFSYLVGLCGSTYNWKGYIVSVISLLLCTTLLKFPIGSSSKIIVLISLSFIATFANLNNISEMLIFLIVGIFCFTTSVTGQSKLKLSLTTFGNSMIFFQLSAGYVDVAIQEHNNYRSRHTSPNVTAYSSDVSVTTTFPKATIKALSWIYF